MSDFANTPASENPIDDAFSALDNALDGLPEGDFITLRHEANPPMYVNLNEGELGLTVRQACDRRGLTLGGNVNCYFDNNQIALDSFVPAGGVVTMVGNVKGG